MRVEENFPVGMRVLAVDDNPVCLTLLVQLLKKCQYHVTSTSQAKTALRMLRENKDTFDLVISDVHMPDMDGFKLLELVGLEMDLPVIMLSGNSDSRLVLKGITHGACDYLVKPVRLEELKNIWQHVVRRKKVDSESQKITHDQDKTDQGGIENGKGPLLSHQNGKLSKRRKDEEEYESDENGNDSDDPATQKKPRVVWSIELHRKFVAAVDHLGLEKAVPKRILDLMNVDGITRENVASHLQKYRLYLKKAAQQANLVAAFGGKDSAYMRMGSLDGLGSFRTLAGSGRFGQQPSLSSYASAGGMIGSRLNNAAGLRNMASIQPNHGQNLSNSLNALPKLNPNVPHVSQNDNLFQGIPPSLELDQFQQSKCAPHMGELNPLSNVSNNPNLLHVNSRKTQMGGGSGNHPQNIASFSSNSFNTGVSSSPNSLDHGRGNENWQNSTQSLKFQSSSFPLNDPFSDSHLAQDRVRDYNTTAGPHLQNSPIDFSSSAIVSLPYEASRGETPCHESLGGAVQIMNQAPCQRWLDQKQLYSQNLNNTFGNLSSQVNGGVASLTHSMGHNNEMVGTRMDMSLIGRSNGGCSAVIHSEREKLTPDSRTRTKEDYLLETTRQQVGFLSQGYDPLDDIMSAIKQEQDGCMLEGGEFGFNAYSFGSGI